MKKLNCPICKKYNFSVDEMKERLSYVNYLNRWERLVWIYFLGKIFPKIETGWEKHKKLIKEKYIYHC